MGLRAGASAFPACPGFQCQPCIFGSKRITFSGLITSPLTVPSPGNFPLPVGVVGVMKGALDRVPVPEFPFHTPYLSSVLDLKTRGLD